MSLFVKIKPVSGHDKIKKKEFIEEIKYIVQKLKYTKVNSTCRFYLKIKFFFKQGGGGKDLDNLLKPVLDALTGVIYKDDIQVFKIESEKELYQFV